MCAWKQFERQLKEIAQKKNKCIIKGIRWKIPYRSKKTFQISTYILNGREITKIVLVKQKNCLNETKIINNK